MASPIASTSRTTLASLLRTSTTTTTNTSTAFRATILARGLSSDVNQATSSDATVAAAEAASAPTAETNTNDDALEKRRLKRTVMNQLSNLGSTQTRVNSFRPHKLRLNPVDAHKLTLSHLVASTAQVGHSLSSLKAANQPYIYGQRHGVAIFDLERATLPALRRAASVVKAVAERDGVILFVGTRTGQQAAVLAATKRLAGNGFHVTAERWMPGVITNAPKLLASAILKSMDDLDPTGAANTNRLASQTLQPDLVVVLNPVENSFAIREATQANIPTIAITDSDVDPRSVTYPIPANDDSIRSVELIIGVLSKAGEEGLKLRAKKLDEADKIERKVIRTLKQRIEGANFDPRSRSAPIRTTRNPEEEDD
ncbi:related to MRP4 - mitochondrial ribosomal protein, small subunit [Melanopsichium pennsylvanicum]|uniref:Related to MRP4 - mitochondrial ribosomal protein, small subunit n=2 Tax=Melanopsichium pennsylvanicum TaxID=63383 RepID=A0AAJ4XL97_9BASI|nr:related to MRP4-mitochondrial ribosomal protein, small subunit [Melanopsichium pennsylvanicum 4]SNX84036.1 related to MRP4 - mitochondrial ribosomal protein, small subunit [Melanopsichium pennsylvanicum]